MSGFTRRDIVHGTLGLPALLGGAAVTGSPLAAASPRTNDYPPALTGLRGSHEGSFEVAHALAREGQREFGPLRNADDRFDLVVVGGGVSGLAAAYFYRQHHPQAKILVLDNHDDFGGHAKRNEFNVNGKHLIGYGGSQTMESPSAYSEVANTLLKELAVDLDGFYDHYDQGFFQRHGLSGGLFFDRETYGRPAFVNASLFGAADFLGLAEGRLQGADAVAAMPLSDADKTSMLHLMAGSGDAVEDVGFTQLPEYLSGISYLTFLKERLGITSPTLINLLHDLPSGYYGIGIDQIPAIEAMLLGMPGGTHLGVPGFNWLRGLLGGLADPYIHHFPDGNASIARLLVRSLIPEVAAAVQPADLVTAQFDYGQLDQPHHLVRIRLNSTAVGVSQSGQQVTVRYVQDGQHIAVRAQHCVLACYNAIIPYLCPDMSTVQKQALAQQVKVPLVYTNVVLNNWRALKQLGIGQCFAPNMFHKMMMVDFPVSMGSYRFTQTPDDPVVLHLSSAFGASGLAPADQFRVGRARLLGTSYAQIEADILNFLDQLLGEADFSIERDIAAITVNRWPHGYAYGHYPLHDPQYPEGQAPHEIGRRTWGNVAIANSDAGARAYLDEAINQAHRAVSELV